MITESLSAYFSRAFDNISIIAGENKPQNYMQLAGRVLICLMFLTLLGEMSFDNFFTEIVRAVEIIVSLTFSVSL